MLGVRLGGASLDLYLNLHRAGSLELQTQRKTLAGHQGLFQPKQHDVVAAGGKYRLTCGGDAHRVELLHFHHLAQLHHGVDLGLGGLRSLHPDQPISRFAQVMHDKISAAGLRIGGQLAGPGAIDFQLGRAVVMAKAQAAGQGQCGCSQ